MNKYGIEDALFKQALEELRAKFGDNAERAFAHSWEYATNAQKTRAPKKKSRAEIEQTYAIPEGTRPEVAARMKAFAAKQVESAVQSADETYATMVRIHRNNLIQLFTMNDGVSQATAEKIVDQYFIQKD